ncbi:MAG: PL29 family lyase N-terminal domain-containing protein [Bacteroidales bacterium]|nr:PL29 family lyase N-terminal domain-containing protein [Bacteroidales bacterium]
MLCAGCYDDTQLKTDIADLQSRVTAIENWCTTANSQISALQSLVQALEEKDYVTGVAPLADGTGYTISFTKSKPVTIKHGEKGDKGDKGDDAIAPVIGVALDTDGNYYWTVKIGAADPVWMLDADGNKIRTTGDNGKDAVSPQVRINSATNMWEISVDGGVSWVSTGVAATGAAGAAGVSPQVRINSATNTWEISVDGGVSWTGTGVAATGATGAAGKDGKDGKDGSSPVVSVKLFTDGNYYWTINGEWLIVDGNFVPATGPQGQRGATGPKGDAVFAANGIDNTNADYVGFTLANGTKIQLPRYKPFKIGNDAVNDAITLTAADITVPLKLPSGFVESDYSSIMARMITKNTTDSDIKTKAGVGPAWEVTVNKPTFTAGVCNDNASVNIKPIMGQLAVGDNSMLEVSLIDADGGKITASRVITAGPIATADPTNHTVNVITRGSLTSSLIDDAVSGSNTLIINGLLSGENTANIAITGDWNVLRTFIQARTANIDLTLNNVENVIGGALHNCQKLASVSLPNAVSVGWTAFGGCSQLATVDLPNATSVGNWAFYGCTHLTTIDLPNVVSVNSLAFEECTQLTTVSLPKVTSVGEGAFSCTALTTLKLAASSAINPFGSNVFLGVTTGSCDLYIGTAEIAAQSVTLGNNQPWRSKTWKSISQYSL